MTTKKILGYIFIVLAVIMTLTILGLFSEIFRAIAGFFMIFSGSLDDYQIGKVIGSLIYWVFHVCITIALWVYGTRWIKLKTAHGKT